ncbi:MAG: sensor domain-containing diguanylate cyclase [Psychrobium sp.]|nr:sensor domain-containing diguanylate cyclase [Psychrobium sp.]
MLNKNDWLLTAPQNLISLDKWQKTVNLLSKIFNAPASFVVQYTTKGFQVTLASQQPENPYPAGTIIESDVNIFCSRIVQTRQELYVQDAPLDACWDTNPEVSNDGFRSYLGVPIFWPDGSPFGTFCVMDFKKTAYDKTYLELIRQLKDILESDLKLSNVFEEIRQMAITDTLTNLNNRRGFMTLAKQRVALAQRLKNKLGLLYMDIDCFKSVNDNHGHAIGDKTIKVVAQSMRHSLRSSDVLGRIGGDEFVAIVMLDKDNDIDVIKRRFEHALIDYTQQAGIPTFEVSCGFSLIQAQHISIEDVLNAADIDMYAQKQRLNH